MWNKKHGETHTHIHKMLMIGVNLQYSNLLFIPHSRRWGDSLTHSQNATCPMISNEVESSTCSRQTPFYHLSGPRFISHSLLSSSIISHSIEALSYRVAPPPPTFVGVSRVWKKKKDTALDGNGSFECCSPAAVQSPKGWWSSLSRCFLPAQKNNQACTSHEVEK